MLMTGSTWRPFRKKLQCSPCHINQKNTSRAVVWRQLSSRYLPCILITSPAGGESAPRQAGREGRPGTPAPCVWGAAPTPETHAAGDRDHR